MEDSKGEVRLLGSGSPGHATQTLIKGNGQKRKREHSSDGEEHGEHIKKRACNECRQQKLKCDVVPEPYERCARCTRLKLECRIDANFKRVGKRSKTAQMEREIIELRKQLADRGATTPLDSTYVASPPETAQGIQSNHNDLSSVPHQGLADSLLSLRKGVDTSNLRLASLGSRTTRILGTTILESFQVDDLFRQYFTLYHPFLPVLDPDKTPDQYFDLSPLLYWSIIVTAARRYEFEPTLLTGIRDDFSRLIWSTISDVPQNYHVVKALAILCTWPLPTKSTSTDQTFILSGIMMQISLQTGLHRPSHAQDFSRTSVELKEDDIRDRLTTWALCNIVAQNVSTGNGQPPSSVYDWTLTSLTEPASDGSSMLPEIYWRLQIERFSNKVSQALYNNKTDPIGIAGAQERAAWISLLNEDYDALEQHVTRNASLIALLHVHAAGLHLRLSVFFDSPSAPNYVSDLLQLHFSASKFLNSARELDIKSDSALKFAPRYIVLMILAGGFTLMKLLNSFFARHLDVEKSRILFNGTIHCIRSASCTNNDLPARLAEVLAQLWRTYGAGLRVNSGAIDSSLQLKVRRRMSMSLVYDSVWRWREEFLFKGDGTTADLDSAVNNPTNPDVVADGQILLDPSLPDPNMPSAGLNDPMVDYNYEVFDPLTWMLDGTMDLPYNDGELMGMPDDNLFH